MTGSGDGGDVMFVLVLLLKEGQSSFLRCARREDCARLEAAIDGSAGGRQRACPGRSPDFSPPPSEPGDDVERLSLERKRDHRNDTLHTNTPVPLATNHPGTRLTLYSAGSRNEMGPENPAVTSGRTMQVICLRGLLKRESSCLVPERKSPGCVSRAVFSNHSMR